MQMAKVFGLMTIMTVLFVITGDYIGGSSMAAVFFGISMVMNFWTFWFSDRAVLKMYRAQVIGPEDAPELFSMVDRLRQRADLPMPKVAIAPAMPAATVPTSMCRCLMCASSCAITPSSSLSLSASMRPSVTHTTAFSGFRPVANALGCLSGATATLGIGRSAR